ncbi:MAG: hypothetical protein ACXADU_10345 [Promethearchaeota archaeon]|jgi:hypothetical protein
MSTVPAVENNVVELRKFIDWDKFKNVFYNNFYLENYKIVIKMPLIPKKDKKSDIKIKKFDLEKYTYLCSY